MKTIISIALILGLASCSLNYNPATGGLSLTNDPVAVQALANAATARINKELAEKTGQKQPEVKPVK